MAVTYVISNRILLSDKGDSRDKINAINSKISTFGGTYIFFDKDVFYFGGLHLSCITYDTANFIDYNTNVVYKFPLANFSEKFLFSMLIAYLVECKKSLTKKAFDEIVKDLEEKFA